MRLVEFWEDVMTVGQVVGGLKYLRMLTLGTGDKINKTRYPAY